MLIVVEHFDTFHRYFLTPVYPPLYLTLTDVVLFSYIRGLFVYCPFLLGRFTL